MTDIVIAAGARTPIGTIGGSLSNFEASELGQVVIAEALSRAKIDTEEVSEVIMGQVLAAGKGQNPARQASISAGVPIEVPAVTINQVCGSGLRAVAVGASSIQSGDSTIVVAGGQESMSNSPHCAQMRDGKKMGDVQLIDTMIKDGS